ncbi:MAG TPA: glycosyltransferase family 2 protein [Vicinamibacterales bacterium]|nr:glycosyltransferase family 2 protein [Vicinamibacterales bacterium]
MEWVFWISAGVVAYVYGGYPLLLGVWARAAGRRPRKAPVAAISSWPSISIVVAARNEAHRLRQRVENLLGIAYPGEREVIVVSDGSTDDPASALRSFRDGVRLIEVPAGGKPLALNAGVEAARGEIVVFADARQRFDDRALVELVANFADERVGGVTGELILDAEQQAGVSTVGDGVGLYWKYEKWLRRHESQVWSTLGATGAIYAMRRALWRPLPPDTLLDDVLAPMRAVLEGWRIVFDDAARAYDRAPADAAAESRRKVRTLAGNYQILAQEPRLLLPVVNPVWLQYASHKIGRLLVPWALVALLVSSATLVLSHWVYAAAFAAQAAMYGLAAYGAWTEHRARRASGFATAVGGAAR